MISRPQFNIEVNQNSTFKLTIQITGPDGVTPFGVSDWTFSGSIKENYLESPVPLLYFTASVLDVANSIVEFSLIPYQTAVLTQASYFYDCTGTKHSPTPDEVYRILEGRVKVYPGVTDPHLTDPD